ncbi:chitobiosyldiphosphodolichol beta-mannosyltransferase [Cylas formicarius]|uniref:chitobiosyldiphosphodolichol beta-mannosyltransferase n=1 Tax=Cylas formicarius TaxID=197179 RepID=UPI00295882A2|nr:chitobiosyldiphosphodolichol beta-mannosyltransferase [Cylas formicarius]
MQEWCKRENGFIKMSIRKKNVCVVVLGDIGRSPRMQYHSLSLAENGHFVDVIGYGETQPMDSIKLNPFVYYHYMFPVPQIPLKLLNYAFKTIFQALNLLFLLFTIRKPHIVLVQNPPAIPSLLLCWLYCKIARSKFVIDWHNYAHTIMALNLSKQNTLVKLTEKCEAFVGSRADCNFCVTNEMRLDLAKQWNVKAVTLYDKPPLMFKPINLKDKHEFLLRLGKLYPNILDKENSTVFTEKLKGEVLLKVNRPGFLVSSTSWTEDEDFSVLFSAFEEFENHHLNGNQKKLPDLICFITGKGHLKDFYTKKIEEQNWKHVKVITPWLESSDYPLLLACADLGVSLHTSSSGLDLPMKVVDMFGCGLPVFAYNFKCLSELVVDGENGYTFQTVKELCDKLLNWFEEFPMNRKQIDIRNKFTANLEVFQKNRWAENWQQIAYPFFR